MKRAFILFWHGLTGILVGVANWFTVILGMRDDSKYGLFIRRTVGTCFAIIMITIAVAFVIAFGEAVYEKLGLDDNEYSYEYGDQYISRNVSYYNDEYGQEGYLIDGSCKKILKHIDWIAKPLGYDSLVCYSDGKKRGYFNMFTGKVEIEPTYDHAWIFSEGLAAVEDGGKIKFIDQTGKVVIDRQLPYINGADGYVFHDGFCIVHNDRRDLFGLIDHKGNWVLQPKYFSIENGDSLWIVDDGKQEAVLDCKMHEVIPFSDADYEFSGDGILATMPDHTLREYNRQGELLEEFYIQSVNQITYQTDKENIARNLCYEVASGWYGLMSPDGKVLTPPSYNDISAIAYDTYLCKPTYDGGIILNGKGERVK